MYKDVEVQKTLIMEDLKQEPFGTPRRRALIDEYKELDEVTRQAQDSKVKRITSIGGMILTLVLGVLTLNFERTETLRSKVTNLWLRRQ